MNLPILHLDRSNTYRGFCFEQDGQPVNTEAAFASGFVITPEDAPAVLTLLSQFIRTKEENAR